MKQCLLAVVGLFGGMCAFVMLLGATGAAVRESPQETVLTVSLPEKPTQAVVEELEFPFPVPGTTLTARALALYEGELLEVDTGEYIVDAAALEVENYGDREVAVAYIVLFIQGEEYHFFGTDLPPDSTSLLVEMDGKPYTTNLCSDCTAWARYAEDRQTLGSVLALSEVGIDTIRVENISQQPQEDILLYYKNYLPEGDLYLGGVTYQIYIGTLDPGQHIEISPFRYVSGYSKVIKAVPH